jgi:predicted N-acetyltransferase YhbS
MGDVMAVHRFLVRTYARTRDTTNWEVRRWEGRYWHEDPADLAEILAEPQSNVRIWEQAGVVVGVAHPEDRGDLHLEIDPDRRDLEPEMVAWAEAALSTVDEDGSSSLTTFSLEHDAFRNHLLAERGYQPQEWGEVHRTRLLDSDVEAPDVAPGYVIRSIVEGDHVDARGLAAVINAAFGHSFGANALLNFERSPSFDADLQMVAVDPSGAIVAHTGVTLDTDNRLAIVEPVCTDPEHRRAGLATATMAEGLNRARRKGAVRATVSTGWENPSNRVYAGLGFSDTAIVTAWTRRWPPHV